MNNYEKEYAALQSICADLEDLPLKEFINNKLAGLHAVAALTDEGEPAIVIHDAHRGFIVVPGDEIDLLSVADDDMPNILAANKLQNTSHVTHLSVMSYALTGLNPQYVHDFFDRGREVEPLSLSMAVLLYIKFYTVHTYS